VPTLLPHVCCWPSFC